MSLLSHGVMVAHLPLEERVGVRVPVGQLFIVQWCSGRTGVFEALSYGSIPYWTTTLLPDSVTVARHALNVLVWVQILFGQPLISFLSIPYLIAHFLTAPLVTPYCLPIDTIDIFFISSSRISFVG